MKIRDSRMSDAGTWERFFDPAFALRQLRFTIDHQDVADFGCGYGVFSVAAAQLASDAVYALDLDRDMVLATRANAERRR